MDDPVKLVTGRCNSPLGPLGFALADGALAALEFAEGLEALRPRMVRRFGRIPEVDGDAERALTGRIERYFGGEIRALDDVAVDAEGTAFQKRVWAALREIPAGETRTYGELASAIGEPRAVRAAGAANGRNPVAIVVPCHRVIGSDGALTGYGGGVWRKRWLLEHERKHAGR